MTKISNENGPRKLNDVMRSLILEQHRCVMPKTYLEMQELGS